MNITLPFPPSVNSLYADGARGKFTRKRPKSKVYVKWRTLAMGELLLQKVKLVPGPVRIRLLYSPPDKRKRGIDNYPKAVLDLLVDAGVILDDEQSLRGFSADWDETRKPGCYITVRQV